MARCSALCPSSPSARITSASVFQSLFAFISLLKSWSTVVGPVPSKRTRTLSFFFKLFGAFKLSGEEIIHNQRRNKRANAKILLRIVVQDVQVELIATFDQAGEKFVHPEFLFVSPLADGVHEPPLA